MQVTQNSDAPAPEGDALDMRLRVEVYDALAKQRGVATVTAQAAYHGMHRATLIRIRSGERLPRLEMALHMAAQLGTTVEALFERKTDA